MINNNDIYINIDQNLPPMIIDENTFTINGNFNYISSIDLTLNNNIADQIIRKIKFMDINQEIGELSITSGEETINKNKISFSFSNTEGFENLYNNLFKLNYCKIQLKINYNEKDYYSNYGISRIIKKEDYNYELIKENNNYYLKYKTNLENKDNLLNFYKYQILNDEEEIIYHKDWTLNETINNNLEDQNYISKIPIKNIILNPGHIYKIIFYGKTNLGIEFKLEENIQSYDLYPILFPAKINLINNYENGYIKINFIPWFDFNESFENDYFTNNHHYELYRTDEFSNFENWEYITDFRINQYSIKTFNFKDYQIMQGIKYKYGIKAVNISDIKTQMLKSDYIVADFEDMFLIDSELNLKIKFNPKISSFKTTKNENKAETLGQKYPYIVRNGMLGYKEMPISGLISFQMDIDNKIFNENNDELKDFVNTDLVGENIMKERKYKNYILNWLNNNKYKVLKTPTEGNFIVQLINVGLTPIDSLGRMLHSFQATAYEMDEYNYENIKKYNIFINKFIEEKPLRIESFNIYNYDIDWFDKKPNDNLNLKITRKDITNDDITKTLETIEFNDIELEMLQIYGAKPGDLIKVTYLNNTTTDIYISNSRENIFENAKDIKKITYPAQFDSSGNFLNNTQMGITYSWIDKNIHGDFNNIVQIKEKEDIQKLFQIETINFQEIDADKIKINKTNFNFTYETTNANNANGFFIVGNNIYDMTKKKHIKSYLYNKVSSALSSPTITIPQSIKIYPKSNISQNSTNSLDFSFFVEYNNNEFYKRQKIKPNQIYKVPEFGCIEIDNLDMIDSLWIGKNLIADLNYISYDYDIKSE